MEVDICCCPTATFSLAHRPDLELLLRIWTEPSRRDGGGGERKSWLGCNGVGPLESEKGGEDIFLFYNVAVIMLWFDNVCGVKWRKAEPELTSQVSASLVLFSVQLESVAAAARLLATGTRGSSSRGHHTPVSVLLCLCPRRLAGWLGLLTGWLAKPTRRVLASLTRRANPSPPRPLPPLLFLFFFFRLANDGFCGATEADYSRCFRRGVKPAEKYWFVPPLSHRRTARASRKWKKEHNAACMFCILQELHAVGIVFHVSEMCFIWFINA